METLTDISLEDPEQIYLVDHAWTFQTSTARAQLEQTPGLAERMARLMGLEGEGGECLEGGLLEGVLRERWRFAQMYSLGGATVKERQPVWYMMDELGSSVPHPCSPSVCMLTFLWAGDGLDYIEGLERGR